jgi:hypothetical protein
MGNLEERMLDEIERLAGVLLLRDKIIRMQKVKIIQLEDQIKASGGLKCPNCDDEGTVQEGYVDGHGSLQVVQVQCEFCCTVTESIFNRRATLLTGGGDE